MLLTVKNSSLTSMKKNNPAPRITPNHFYQYLKCPSWVWLDAFEEREKPFRLHPLSELLLQEGLIDHAKLLEGRDITTVVADDIDEAATETLELMHRGVPAIYRGVLVHEHWVARPDILERVEGRSDFGDYYYVACDLKQIREMEDVHRFQGVFYSELLRKVQGTRPTQGYVLTADGKTLSFPIEPSIAKFNVVLSDIEQILAGKKPAPFLGSGCRESPWLSRCMQEAETCDDISLIARIRPAEYRAFCDAGITTIERFLSMTLEESVARVPLVPQMRLETLRRQAEILRSGVPKLLEKQPFPQALVELYVDIERDPLRDVCYLFGGIVRRGNEITYHPFFADTPNDERVAWEGFRKFRERFPAAPLYHFGAGDTAALRAIAERYGHVAHTFSNTIDLATVTRHAAIFPVYAYSLKDLATTIGFQFRDREASEPGSAFWYHRWVETENNSIRERILAANEDELRATVALRDWLATGVAVPKRSAVSIPVRSEDDWV